ncbi:BON domain-containing protein [Sorangium sp. So ce1153]|uniref:BON domain-containing protein n=1 Tax=Sorangium sp. So ce1153 TaxID=3133333 RepID=UPI003F631FA5
MRDQFDRDTGYGRAERGWDERYRNDRSHLSERGWYGDERRGAGPTYDHGVAARVHGEHRDWGRDHDRGHGRAAQRDYRSSSRDEGRFAGGDRGAADADRGWVSDDRGGDYDGRDDSYTFGGNPIEGTASAYNRNLGGAYSLGMTRVVNPDGWHGGPYRGESHEQAHTAHESGRSAMEGVSHALHEIGDRVRSALGRGPKGYKRSDARIQEDICELLSDRHDIDVSDVTVQVQGNEVTLEGTVPERHHKRIIEHVAEGVRGVEDVHNRIRVQRAIEPATRSTATAGTLGDAALASTRHGASRPASSHVARG